MISAFEQELKREGLKAVEVPELKRGLPDKVHLARVLHRETTRELSEIAGLRRAGHWRPLSNAVSLKIPM